MNNLAVLRKRQEDFYGESGVLLKQYIIERINEKFDKPTSVDDVMITEASVTMLEFVYEYMLGMRTWDNVVELINNSIDSAVLIVQCVRALEAK